MSFFLPGLQQILEPLNLVLLVGGSFIGVMVGAIPGLNSAIIIALILPLTIGMTPVQAFIGLTALYCASIYGGSISAILINVPGTPEACADDLRRVCPDPKGAGGKSPWRPFRRRLSAGLSVYGFSSSFLRNLQNLRWSLGRQSTSLWACWVSAPSSA